MERELAIIYNGLGEEKSILMDEESEQAIIMDEEIEQQPVSGL